VWLLAAMPLFLIYIQRFTTTVFSLIEQEISTSATEPPAVLVLISCRFLDNGCTVGGQRTYAFHRPIGHLYLIGGLTTIVSDAKLNHLVS